MEVPKSVENEIQQFIKQHQEALKTMLQKYTGLNFVKTKKYKLKKLPMWNWGYSR